MKAVVLAGGVGRRLDPYTLTIPKPMMPIGDRPILELLVARLRRCGIRDLVFAIGHLGEIIRDHFGDGRAFDVSIEYSKEERPLGTAGPLDLVRPALGATFLVINGDILADLDVAGIIADHRQRTSDATVVLARHAETIDFGVVDIDARGEVVAWHEKPIVERLVSAGVYVLEPTTLAHLAPGASADLPQFVMTLVAAGMRVRGHVHPGYWLDIGRPADYARACHDAARFLGP
jgi:NDP-sugar pyrophosphorylase family protein